MLLEVLSDTHVNINALEDHLENDLENYSAQSSTNPNPSLKGSLNPCWTGMKMNAWYHCYNINNGINEPISSKL